MLAALLVLAALSAPLDRVARGGAGYILAAGFAAGAVALALQSPGVVAGEPLTVAWAWSPSLQLELAFRLDALALLFALLVLGMGAVVMAYSARYLPSRGGNGRLYGLLTLFAFAMLGLVLADNVLVLFIFWELTSVCSFLLIGGRGEGRTGATRALLTTGGGGLALLAGLLLLAVATGSTSLGEILGDPAVVRSHPFSTAIMVLLLIGAFTKSAQLPFSYWLPGAMVAPTPVSTYLHAATMVKAGIYLLLRFSAVYAETPAWRGTLIVAGLSTAVWGAAVALRQYDLKSLLAYSTISQLGLLVGMIGVGTPHALAAAALHTVAHALYKASLFMVVGVIDHEAGSRDIRELEGLRQVMPLTAAVTALAALSMAGVPPLVGFVSKEEAFAAFLAAPGEAWLAPVATALAALASIMTFAYGTRIYDGAFAGVLRQPLHAPPTAFVAPAVLTSVAGLALAPVVGLLDPLVNAINGSVLGEFADSHLALWHGFTPALGLSALVVAAGSLLYLARHRLDTALSRRRPVVRGADVFDAAYDGALTVGSWVGRSAGPRGPFGYIAPVLGTVAATSAAVVLAGGAGSRGTPPAAPAADWVIVALLAVAVLGVVTSRTRLGGIALLGVTGFLIAVWYVLLGAPDLALTQLLVETLTVVVAVLVLRRLPARFDVPPALRRHGAALLSAAVGLTAGAATYRLTGRRELSAAGDYYLRNAEAETGGTNVVNTILVDFRALDTLGEITVLAVAALGVLALLGSVGRRVES